MLCVVVQILCDVYKVELTVFTGQSVMRTVVEKMKHVTLTRELLLLAVQSVLHQCRKRCFVLCQK